MGKWTYLCHFKVLSHEKPLLVYSLYESNCTGDAVPLCEALIKKNKVQCHSGSSNQDGEGTQSLGNAKDIHIIKDRRFLVEAVMQNVSLNM